MPFVRVLQGLPATTLAAFLLVSPAAAQDGHAPQTPKAKAAAEKPPADKSVEADASRFCAAVAPSIAEARIAWQTKRLAELDAQVKQRIADLEKTEASAREWIAKREALATSANDGLVAIFAKMEPEAAARELSALDDRMAAAILGKLKPNAAGAILDEMEADRASRLVGVLSAANAEGKKS
jgi:flagellar motility protein MotE (MotC chaperone)